jgi:hypothetical protein
MPAATNHGGLVSEDTNGNAGTVMPSTMNDSGSASIACVATPNKEIRNPYLTPPRASTTDSANTPKTLIKRPLTHEEWESFDAFCCAFHSGERAEANRRNLLDIQKANAMAAEQARQQLPTNNSFRRPPNHQQAASNSVRPCPCGLHCKHVFTILCAMKCIMDWDEEEEEICH